MISSTPAPLTDGSTDTGNKLGRPFVLLWSNSISFQLIASADRFTFVWLTTEVLNGSDRVAGLIVFLIGLPTFLFVLPAGALSDRGNRKRQLFTSQFAGATVTATAATLVWTNRMSVPIAAIIAVLFGSAFALAQPVRAALVPLLVPRHMLLKAIPLMTIGSNLAIVVGPIVAGSTIDRRGVGAAFALQCALFLLSALFITKLEIPEVVPGPKRQLRADIRAGLRYIWDNPLLRTLFVLMSLGGATMQGPAFLLLPRIARVTFHRNAREASALFTAMGVGMVIMSFTLLRIRGRLRRRGLLFMLTLIAATTNSVIQGILPSYRALLICMFIWGLIGGVWANMNQTLVQEITTADMMGRVMSVVALVTTGLAPLSALAAGAIAARIGAQHTIGIFGLFGLFVSLTTLVRGHTLRRFN